jgi:hypothetical protein
MLLGRAKFRFILCMFCTDFRSVIMLAVSLTHLTLYSESEGELGVVRWFLLCCFLYDATKHNAVNYVCDRCLGFEMGLRIPSSKKNMFYSSDK